MTGSFSARFTKSKRHVTFCIIRFMDTTVNVSRSRSIARRVAGTIHISRIAAQTAGLLRFIKGKLVLPKTKAPLLVPERSSDLFREIFVAFFRKFNLAYLYPLGPDASALQSCVAYTLCRLDVVAVDWVASGNLAESVLLPVSRVEMRIARPVS